MRNKMGIKEGDRIFHVTASGKVFKALAMSNERNNAVLVMYDHSGLTNEVGTWHLFVTEVGAKRASESLRRGIEK
jgi:hypothetical protein